MQEPTGFQQQMKIPAFPEQEQLKCPRCDSNNTKFCYYNNYNLSQPRHFCKNCRRYWTKGGALRNVPIGGGTRKSTKRSSSTNSNPKRQPNPAPDPLPPSTSSTIPQQVVFNSSIQNSGSDAEPTRMYVLPVDHQDRKMMDIGGSFRSLLATNGQFGNLLQELNPNGSDLKTVRRGEFGPCSDTDAGMDQGPGLGESNDNGESYLGGGTGTGTGTGDTSCWTGGSNGWPDLSIYTPGSNFH